MHLWNLTFPKLRRSNVSKKSNNRRCLIRSNKNNLDKVNSDARNKRSETLNTILNTQEKQIISLRFGIPGGNEMTLEQVGKVLGITRERVRQIQNKALDKLRGHPSIKTLKGYIEE